jgi:hypothetical protein
MNALQYHFGKCAVYLVASNMISPHDYIITSSNWRYFSNKWLLKEYIIAGKVAIYLLAEGIYCNFWTVLYNYKSKSHTQILVNINKLKLKPWLQIETFIIKL